MSRIVAPSERTLTGFRVGSVVVMYAASLPRGEAVIVEVGDAEIEVIGTPAGRRAHVHVRHGTGTICEVTQTLWSSEEDR